MATNHGGRSPAQREALTQAFGSLPHAEGVHEVLVNVRDEDYRGSIAGDFYECAIARACTRMFGSTAVVFMSTIAYVDLPGPDGKRVVYRFELSEEAKRFVERIDSGKKVRTDVGLRLIPPRPSRTRAAKKEEKYKSRERRKEAIARGEIIDDKPRKKATKRTATMPLLRDGTGLIHAPTQ